MDPEHLISPSHHAAYPGFGGLTGLIAALTMLAGRGASARLAESLSGLAAGETLADIGCGPGAAARRAARRNVRVVAVDPAPVMLRVARLVTRRSDRVQFAAGRAEALPLAGASVSVAWSIASVHHWADVDAGLREVARVLVPGGRFVAIERRTPPGAQGLAGHGWTDEQAAALAARCLASGLQDVRSGTHGHGRHVVVSVTSRRP